jgi:hypothetical protein
MNHQVLLTGSDNTTVEAVPVKYTGYGDVLENCVSQCLFILIVLMCGIVMRRVLQVYEDNKRNLPCQVLISSSRPSSCSASNLQNEEFQ